MLERDHVKAAEDEIGKAESALLRREIIEAALDYGPEVRAQVRELILSGDLDKAMSIVCS